jgi:hypothetical protein
MSINSWVGTVWSLRGVPGHVIGHVQTDEGQTVIMTVFGLGGHAPDGVEILPSRYGFVRYARVSLETLRGQWQRLGGPEAKELLSA